MNLHALLTARERRAIREEWRRWMTTPLPEWPADMDHSLAMPPVRCRRCTEAKSPLEFHPSDVRPFRARDGVFHAALNVCKRCRRIAQRKRLGSRPQRRYAAEATA